MTEDTKPGPTGLFPRGQIRGDDDGELRLAIGLTRDKDTLIIDFGTPTTWIGFDKAHLTGFIELLQKHLRNMAD